MGENANTTISLLDKLLKQHYSVTRIIDILTMRPFVETQFFPKDKP